jgi:uncharacterized protein (TIGR02466 family)
MSSRYQIKRLWNGIAPILTTNLIETGVVAAALNESLTQAAVTAFDRYTNSTPGTSSSDASAANNRRRRRRTSSSAAQAKHSTIDLITDAHSSESSSTAPTPNDNFFEYQRRVGYTLNNNQHRSSDEDVFLQQLKETHISNAIIYYLQHFHINDGQDNNSATLQQQRLTNSIIDVLQSDSSPELTIDLWAAVQRGEGAHHKFHVHEGAIVSGAYYSNCPLGCAPLVLRRPVLDRDCNVVDCAQNDGGLVRENNDDAVLHPINGQLVLFPPWLKHGVPLAKELKREESSASSTLPRVSWAFNLTARLAHIGNAWDVTRPS